MSDKGKEGSMAASSAPPRHQFAEDVFGDKLDMCFTDTIVKAGSGAALGALSSLLFFRRRWPIVAGMGIGIGLAWANCEHELNAQTQQLLKK